MCSLDKFFSREIKTNFSYWLRRKSLYFFLNASTDLLVLISFGVSFLFFKNEFAEVGFSI